MTSLLHSTCYTAILSKAGHVVRRNSIFRISAQSPWRTGSSTVNLEFLLLKFGGRSYASRSKKSSRVCVSQLKRDPKPVVEGTDSFFVVRKGDLVGVYKSLSECQLQVGTSVCDPPVSVYYGNSMTKETEEYLRACGLKNALFSIRAADLTDELFSNLQPPLGETSTDNTTRKSFLGMISPDHLHGSCTLEFDGASKGNPGLAGAGAILRADDGNWTCRLREGLGVATCNFAEYRAMILGLKVALHKGFTSIRVQGDSKLVCMQIGGQWKARKQNMRTLHEEAIKLKDEFLSFQIDHVLRDLNSEADSLANFAVRLADGQIEEEIDNTEHIARATPV
ncbi:RNA processing factor [Lithospermum erythrorhizon]|uniref:RNA processing factor n=1 Tax=Lithospermum erythrorhizon TaxID=34254 RepID=A0AAV3PDZ8_LITER